MKDEIKQFIEALAAAKLVGSVFNQYSSDLRVNSIRRSNLSLYLQQMASLQPQVLLLGEAPGYRGCRLTGVPFTSEFILLQGLDEVGLFGESRGYRKTDEFTKLWKEASATMVWETLVTTHPVPLIWNAFPFHPFLGENEQSNRKPTRSELVIGQVYLQKLIQLFEIEVVVAVGNTASDSLRAMGIAHHQVRHPSYGGKTQFARGIRELIPNYPDIHSW